MFSVVCLPLQQLDTVCKPEFLHQRYEKWNVDLEIYIIASDVSNAEQKGLYYYHQEASVKYGKISWNSKKMSKRQAPKEMYTSNTILQWPFPSQEKYTKSPHKLFEMEPNMGEMVSNLH